MTTRLRCLAPHLVVLLVFAAAVALPAATAQAAASCDPRILGCNAETGTDSTGGGSVDDPTDSAAGTRPPATTCTPPSGVGVPADVGCDGCVWKPLGAHGTPPQPGFLPYQVTCYPQNMNGPNHGAHIVWLPPHQPAGNGMTAQLLAVRAAASFRLHAPAIGTNPPWGTLTGLPTFLYLSPAGWHAATAKADDGVKAVTVTATPHQAEWSMGETGREGTVFICFGPGARYDPTGPDQQTPQCGYTYARTSNLAGLPAGYPVTATITWQITWTCTGACDTAGGTLDPLRTISRTRLIVKQARAQLEDH